MGEPGIALLGRTRSGGFQSRVFLSLGTRSTSASQVGRGGCRQRCPRGESHAVPCSRKQKGTGVGRTRHEILDTERFSPPPRTDSKKYSLRVNQGRNAPMQALSQK